VAGRKALHDSRLPPFSEFANSIPKFCEIFHFKPNFREWPVVRRDNNGGEPRFFDNSAVGGEKRDFSSIPTED
jgi:hypothetical protein